ncbi:MFS transporter [Streptomonospora salina]|uniref:Putative MFS family arabinose efflux permease n=1 Tax=Streptomonospora salina TaxID=104205 RepID=A0A841EJW8_9ACTN|nr:MFS transporter [Streptomonospora salina]MBB5999711.1 putative MFS family arabinose efflux permease [Streptomonospora salina]
MLGLLLRARTYRRLLAAQVVALAGTGLATVALGLLAFRLAGDDASRVMATALTIKMVCYVVAGPLLAGLTVRLPRRAVLVGSDAVRAGAVAVLPWADQLWQVYALVALLQTASAAFTPAFQALIPEIVDDADYTSALALSRLAYDLEAVASPALAAALLLAVPFSGLFVCTAAGFAASALLVAGTRLPGSTGRGSPSRLAGALGGMRAFAARPPLRALAALNLAVAAPTALVLVDTVVYVRGPLGGTDTGVALALGCFGAGSMAVALTLPHLPMPAGVRPVMLAGPVLAAAAAGALAAGWAIAPGPVPLAAAWAALGAGCSLVATLTGRVLRDSGADCGLPPLFAAQFSLSHACFLATYPLAGWAGTQLAPEAAFAGTAAVSAVAGGAAALLWRGAVPTPAPVAVRTRAAAGRS